MKSITTFNKIYLCREFVDFRKSIDGLSYLVEAHLKRNALDGSLFVFVCRDRRRIKLLYWDKTGFAIWYKRLEKDTFKYLPRYLVDDMLTLTPEKLEWFSGGLNIFNMKPHEELKYESLC